MPPLPISVPDAPPTWWGYATPVIALLALGVSLASYRTARATYKRAAPRVSASFFPLPPVLDKETGEYKMGFSLTLSNKGLAPVGIESFHIHMLGVIPIYSTAPNELITLRTGLDLPATVPASNSLSWHYTINHVGYSEKDKETDADLIYKHFRRGTRLIVFLGNGDDVRKIYRNRGIEERMIEWMNARFGEPSRRIPR